MAMCGQKGDLSWNNHIRRLEQPQGEVGNGALCRNVVFPAQRLHSKDPQCIGKFGQEV